MKTLLAEAYDFRGFRLLQNLLGFRSHNAESLEANWLLRVVSSTKKTARLDKPDRAVSLLHFSLRSTLFAADRGHDVGFGHRFLRVRRVGLNPCIKVELELGGGFHSGLQSR